MFSRHRFAALVVILIVAGAGCGSVEFCRSLIERGLEVTCAQGWVACTWLSPRLYGTI